MVVEAGGVEDAAEMAAVHASTALEALQGWKGDQVEGLRDLVGQVMGQVNVRYNCFILLSSGMFELSQVSTRKLSRSGIEEGRGASYKEGNDNLAIFCRGKSTHTYIR